MGRPSKLTPAVKVDICRRVKAGLPFVDACRLSAVSYSSFRRAMRADPLFRDAIRGAEAAAVARHVANVGQAADDGCWTASAWFLERRRPREFGSDRGTVRRLERTVRELLAKVAELEARPDRLPHPAPRLAAR